MIVYFNRFMFLFLWFALSKPLFAQDTTNRFQAQFGLGMSISGDFRKNDNQLFEEFEFSTPIVGKNIEASLKYIFKNKRFLAFGVTVQSYTNIINGTGSQGENVITFEDFRLEEELQFYELQYGKLFDNGLDFALGLNYILYFQPILTSSPGIVLRNPESRPDDIGLTLAVGYSIYSIKNLDIAIQAKVFYSLNGLEAITLTPQLRFNF